MGTNRSTRIFLQLTAITGLNLPFFGILDTSHLKLDTDDSPLIFSKVIGFSKNLNDFSHNPFYDISVGPTLTFASEWLVGLVIRVVDLSLPQAETFILLLTVNSLLASLTFFFSFFIKFPLIHASIAVWLLWFINPVYILRPISPGLNLALLIFVITLIYQSSLNQNHTKFHLLIFLGISFLTFSYVFYALIAYIFLIINRLTLQLWSCRFLLNNVLSFFAYSIPLVVYYLYSVLFANSSLLDLSFRWGVINSHFPGAIRTTLTVLLGSIATLTLDARLPRATILSIFFSILVLCNSQIITGVSMEFDSHFYPPSAIFAIVVILLSANSLWQRLNSGLRRINHWTPCAELVIALNVLLLNALIYTTISSQTNAQQNQNIELLQRIAADDLLVSRPKDAVFSAPPSLREYVPLILENKILYAKAGTFFPMTNEEVLKRELLDKYLQGGLQTFTFQDLKISFERHFINFSQKTAIERNFDFFNVSAREEALGYQYRDLFRVAQHYQESLNSRETLIAALNNFKVYYLILDSFPSEDVTKIFQCLPRHLWPTQLQICVR